MAKRRISLTSIPFDVNPLLSPTSNAFKIPKPSSLKKIPLIQPGNRNDLPSKRSWDLMMQSLMYQHGKKKRRVKSKQTFTKTFKTPAINKKKYQDMLRGFTLQNDKQKNYQANLRGMVKKKKGNTSATTSTLTKLVSSFPARNKPIKVFPKSTLVSLVKRLPGAKKKVGNFNQKGGVLPLAMLPVVIGATTLGLGGVGAGAGLGTYKLGRAIMKKKK